MYKSRSVKFIAALLCVIISVSTFMSVTDEKVFAEEIPTGVGVQLSRGQYTTTSYDSFVQYEEKLEINYFNYGLVVFEIDNNQYISVYDFAQIAKFSSNYEMTYNGLRLHKPYYSLVYDDLKLGDIDIEYVGNVYYINEPDSEGIYDSYNVLIELKTILQLTETKFVYDGEALLVYPKLYWNEAIEAIFADLMFDDRYDLEDVTSSLSMFEGNVWTVLTNPKKVLDLIVGFEINKQYRTVLYGILSVKSKKDDYYHYVDSNVDKFDKYMNLSLVRDVMLEHGNSGWYTPAKSEDKKPKFSVSDIVFREFGLEKTPDWFDYGKDSVMKFYDYSYQFKQLKDLDGSYVNALYYGLVNYKEDFGFLEDHFNFYGYDSPYLYDESESIYYQMKNSAPNFSSPVYESLFKIFKDEVKEAPIIKLLDNQTIKDYTNALNFVCNDIFHLDDFSDALLYTGCCKSIMDKCYKNYLRYASENDFVGMKYTVIMYLRTYQYYCSLFNLDSDVNNNLFIGSIPYWKDSDAQYFQEEYDKMTVILDKLSHIDDNVIPGGAEIKYEYTKYLDENGKCIQVDIWDYYGHERNVVVPASIEGGPVTECYASFNNAGIETITFPDTIETITSLCTDSESVVSIDLGGATDVQDSIRHCSNLVSVKGANVLNLEGSISYCEILTDIDFPKLETAESIIYNCDSLKELSLPALENLNNGVYYCAALEKVQFDNLVSINNNFLYHCESLTNVVVPKLCEIGEFSEWNFSYCGFTEINDETFVCDSLTYIPDTWFQYCDELVSVKLPDSIVKTGYKNFYNCNKLQFIDYNNVNDVTGSFPEGCNMLKYISINNYLSIYDNPTEYYKQNRAMLFCEIVRLNDNGYLDLNLNYKHESTTTSDYCLGQLSFIVPCNRYDEFMSDEKYDYHFVMPEHSINNGKCTRCGSSISGAFIGDIFSDGELMEYVYNEFDTNKDFYLTQAEMDAVTEFRYYFDSLYSFDGIEVFSNLTKVAFSVNCYFDDEIDFTGLKKLETIVNDDYRMGWSSARSYNHENHTALLNVRGLTNLKSISYDDHLRSNMYRAIDARDCPNLACIEAYNGELESILLNSNNNIEYIDVHKNKLEELDLTVLPKLKILRCNENYLSRLDLSKCLNLESLNCEYLESIDLSNNKHLNYFCYVSDDPIKIEIGNNPYLVDALHKRWWASEPARMYKTDLGEMHLRNVILLINGVEFDPDNPVIPDIPLPVAPEIAFTLDSINEPVLRKELRQYDLDNDKAISVEELEKITYITLYDDELSDVSELSKLTNLKTLFISRCNLSTIDLSGVPSLEWVNISNSGVKELDISNNPNLIGLDVAFTSITELDLSSSPNLQLAFLKGRIDTSYALGYHYDISEEKAYSIWLCDNAVITIDGQSYIADENRTPVGGDTPTPTPTPEPTPTPAPTPSQPVNDEGVIGFCTRLYTCALGRASDPQGVQSWADAIKSGADGAQAARGFFFSPEFTGKNLDNTEYVKRLYTTFMDREADPAGLQAWVKALDDGATREKVFDGFVNSVEWANVCHKYGIKSGGTAAPTLRIEPNDKILAFTERLYTTCLGRPADPSGLKAWADALANREGSGAKVASGFFFSPEFTNKNLDNTEYVKTLYRTFMDREADPAGLQAWVKALDEGATREKVFDGFTMSPEFGALCEKAGIQPY